MDADLSRYLELQSTSLRNDSESIRIAFKNSTNKGSSFERILRDRIATFSPPDWRATHGEILDSHGVRTGQVDIAVVNTLHPKGYGDGRPEIIMFDAVVAVGEAKLSLTTSECDNALAVAQKVASCKLHDDNNNVLSNGTYDKLPSPPFFLLALRSNVALPTLEAKLCNDLFQCAIVFSQQEQSSAVAVSDTEISSIATDFLAKIGTLADGTERVYLVENPLLVLSWMFARFSVPMLNLTPVIPMYY
jgi:hypothetical protein